MVEHIVHIDGVTGSSPVATTTNPWKQSISEGFSLCSDGSAHPSKKVSIILLPSTKRQKTRTIIGRGYSAPFSMLTEWSLISSTVSKVDSTSFWD